MLISSIINWAKPTRLLSGLSSQHSTPSCKHVERKGGLREKKKREWVEGGLGGTHESLSALHESQKWREETEEEIEEWPGQVEQI